MKPSVTPVTLPASGAVTVTGIRHVIRLQGVCARPGSAVEDKVIDQRTAYQIGHVDEGDLIGRAFIDKAVVHVIDPPKIIGLRGDQDIGVDDRPPIPSSPPK